MKITEKNFRKMLEEMCKESHCSDCPFKYEVDCTDLTYTECGAKEIEKYFAGKKDKPDESECKRCPFWWFNDHYEKDMCNYVGPLDDAPCNQDRPNANLEGGAYA